MVLPRSSVDLVSVGYSLLRNRFVHLLPRIPLRPLGYGCQSVAAIRELDSNSGVNVDENRLRGCWLSDTSAALSC